MKKQLSEPFHTYWHGKSKKSPLKHSPTPDGDHDSQDEHWLKLRQTIQEAAKEQWHQKT